MKGIKTVIALVFILGSYFLGTYQANESCKEKENILKVQITSMQKELSEMKDSLTLTRKELLEYSVKKDDTLKVQLIGNLQKGIKK